MQTECTPKPVQSPLTCIMAIKSADDYKALSQLLVAAKPKIDQAMDQVKTVHFARFVFLQNGTQLAIITEYDGTFEDYISDFAKYLGDVFDQLFQHISDPPPVPVHKHAAELTKWVEEHDVPDTGFYSAYPRYEVVDVLAAADTHIPLPKRRGQSLPV